MKDKKIKIKSVPILDNEIQLAFLEGIIMPNGEFISNGKGQFLTEENKIYIGDKK